jgi:hypothetical protein
MSIKRECLDALAYELNLLGFSLEEIQEKLLAPQLSKIRSLSSTDGQTLSKNLYFDVATAARSIRNGMTATPVCKKWAARMVPRCLGPNGKLKIKIILDYDI